MCRSVSIVAKWVHVMVAGEPSGFLAAILNWRGGSSLTTAASTPALCTLSRSFLSMRIVVDPMSAQTVVRTFPSRVELKRTEEPES